MLDFRNKVFWLYVLVFGVASGLRFIPELFSFSYPAGADIPFYIFELRLMENGFSWDQLYFGTPLLYVLVLFLKGLVGVDWFLFFKFFTPLLNGCVAVSFLYFLRNGLDEKLGWKWSLIGVLFLVFSSAGILMSNGIIRQQLGIVFFFFFLVSFKRRNFKLELLFTVLVCLSHQLVSLMLFMILGFDFIYNYFKHKDVKMETPILMYLIVLTIFVFLFLLPALSSQNWYSELTTHLTSYLSPTSYGIRFTSTPIWNRIYNHFIWYFGFWLGFLFFSYSKFFRNWFVNVSLAFLIPLSFLPLGTIWARFQLMFIYPFSVILACVSNNSKKTKWIIGLFLLFVIFNGLLLSVESTYSMSRSSVPFNEIPNLQMGYDSISEFVNENSLIITSSVGLSWVNLFLLDDNKSAIVISDRTISFTISDNDVVLHRSGIKGHDFYIFRTIEYHVPLRRYDNVFVFHDKYFSPKNTFENYWSFFNKLYKVDNITIYKYGDHQ